MTLPKDPVGRFVYGVVFIPVTLFIVPITVGLYLFDPDGTHWHMLKFIGIELFSVLSIVLCLTLIWCFFAPNWVERIWEQKARHLIITIIISTCLVSLLTIFPGIVNLLLLEEFVIGDWGGHLR